ncbi:MAG TPA: hypothetical protein VMU37_08175, partial [Caulobacteraceae bacterium]|nr:hypothetical protein [Caulobacteraceae bacterium]
LSGRVIGSGNVLDGSTNTVTIRALTVMAGANLTGEGAITVYRNGSFVAKGSATFEGPLDNNGGRIETAGGTLTVQGKLSGDSDSVIDGGIMTFAASAGGTVIFAGSGELVLGQAENAIIQIKGFATDGKTSLDLQDVDFAGANEVSYAGNSVEGELIVKGSNQTVQYNMFGDYEGVTFTATSTNGGNGSIITASTTDAVARFVQAAATFAPSPGPIPLSPTSAGEPSASLALARPALGHR